VSPVVQEYDKDNIDPRAIKRLQKYIQDPELTEERMSSVSRAAASILAWVMAMDSSVEHIEIAT
jgi:dynein heavy chain